MVRYAIAIQVFGATRGIDQDSGFGVGTFIYVVCNAVSIGINGTTTSVYFVC